MSFLRPQRTLSYTLPRHTRLSLQCIYFTSPRFLSVSSSLNAEPHPPNPRPNAPLTLDPALQALLKDADMSLKTMRKENIPPINKERTPKELEVLHVVEKEQEGADLDLEVDVEEDEVFSRHERKSPAASFGSHGIGAVVLPFELQSSIFRLISESDKPLIHADATRLFQSGDIDVDTIEEAWSLHYTPPAYTVPKSTSKNSHIKARLNRVRDGTAFASVVMPAQYAAIRAVLGHIKLRLGDSWVRGVDRVIEWGSGTGAGMWAAMHTFQQPVHEEKNAEEGIRKLADSSVVSYIGIDRRDGLTSIARRLLRDLSHPSITLRGSLHQSDRVSRIDGLGTIALSAFNLSTLGNSGLRRQMAKEMWESGADIIVIIDDASAEGFRHVADAREQLLRLGKREVDAAMRDRLATETTPEAEEVGIEGDGRGKRGSHIIAPCPHDHACPLALHLMAGASKARSSTVQASAQSVRCTFSQRLQRPAFVRRTKHTGRGEEDVGYSYVVIRRGERPRVPERGTTREGRVGAVGRWEEEARADKEASRRIKRWDADGAEIVVEAVEDDPLVQEGTGLTGNALDDALRVEAYSWPRINFPPLKRSGHILIDACMPDGNEMRLTFPRSQGKQIYYDARKSGWGDLFPHTPKNRPVPRYTGPKVKTKATIPPVEDETNVEDEDPILEGQLSKVLTSEAKQEAKARGRGRGGEGALEKSSVKGETRAGWSHVMDELKKKDQRRRRERRRERGAKETGDEM